MKSAFSFCRLVASASLLAFTGTASANLIVNGSFEDPNLNGGWNTYWSIPGWTAVGQYQIEIGAGGIYGVTGFDGQQVMELDSYGNAKVDQIVAIPGGSYTLSFQYAQRSGVSPASGSFDVYWNGSLLGSFAPGSTAMALYSTTVTALANNTVEFLGTGTQDQYGALIDNVQLNGIPDGGMSATLLGLGLLAIGLGRRLMK